MADFPERLSAKEGRYFLNNNLFFAVLVYWTVGVESIVATILSSILDSRANVHPIDLGNSCTCDDDAHR